MKTPNVHTDITGKGPDWRPAEPENGQGPIALSVSEWLRLREIVTASPMPSRRIFAMRTLHKLLALVPEEDRLKWENL